MGLVPSTSRAGAPAFHGVKAYNSTTITVNTGTATALTCDTEEYDTDNFHSTVSNTSRITIPSTLAGYYLLTAGGFWATITAGASIWILLNGTTKLRTATTIPLNSASGYHPIVTVLAHLAAGDYVEGVAFQSSGSNIAFGNAAAPEAQATISATYLGS